MSHLKIRALIEAYEEDGGYDVETLIETLEKNFIPGRVHNCEDEIHQIIPSFCGHDHVIVITESAYDETTMIRREEKPGDFE